MAGSKREIALEWSNKVNRCQGIGCRSRWCDRGLGRKRFFIEAWSIRTKGWKAWVRLWAVPWRVARWVRGGRAIGRRGTESGVCEIKGMPVRARGNCGVKR